MKATSLQLARMPRERWVLSTIINSRCTMGINWILAENMKFSSWGTPSKHWRQ